MSDATTENYVFEVDPEDDAAPYARVEPTQYESLTDSPSTISVESAKREASLMGDDDTDTITFGAQEYDISKFGWNQTMYSAKVAAGWQRSRSALTTVSTAPTHPTR